MDPIENIPVMHQGHLIGIGRVDETGLITADLNGSQILGRKLTEAISEGIITNISFNVEMTMPPATPMSKVQVHFNNPGPLRDHGFQIGNNNVQSNVFGA
jgi:hypothetical protein